MNTVNSGQRTACGERSRTEDSFRQIYSVESEQFRPSTPIQRLRAKNRRGTTMVEVLLAAVILAILAVVVVNSLFYPRFLAVNSTLKQLAVQAGTDFMEQVVSQAYEEITNGLTIASIGITNKYTLNGRTITIDPLIVVESPGAVGTPEYKDLTVKVNYGQTNFVLTTSISL
jgi:type II secretory pathway pseudopilin PulG